MSDDLPQILLIDGLPGSGKSTAAQKVQLEFERAGKPAVVLFETQQNHPLHVFPTDETGAAWPDIHKRISPEGFATQSLQLWKELLDSHGEESTILESFPFQSSVRVLLQMDAPLETIQAYWEMWLAQVSRTSARMIFFEESDPAGLFTAASTTRGPEWTQYMFQAFDQMPYSQNRGWSGPDAVTGMLSGYATLIEHLLRTLSFPILRLESRPLNYEFRQDRISEFLFLGQQANLPAPD